ncbi:MAG: hypothetical protein ABSG68_26885 [Thermoguttaceae bacterium]|jgi:hypothetical protein
MAADKRYRRRVGRLVRDLAAEHGRPDLVFLWDVPAAEHAAWVAGGYGDLPREEYSARIAAVAADLEAAGHHVILVPATVAEMAAALAELDQANTPDGRSVALNLIGARRLKPNP